MKSKREKYQGDIVKRAVFYFSATGVTRKVAQVISKECHVPLIEILSKDPYSMADFDWTKEQSRSSLETKDPHSHPEIIDQTLEAYDEIFLGFPIWWFMAPNIVHTFSEAHDFSNKKLLLLRQVKKVTLERC